MDVHALQRNRGTKNKCPLVHSEKRLPIGNLGRLENAFFTNLTRKFILVDYASILLQYFSSTMLHVIHNLHVLIRDEYLSCKIYKLRVKSTGISQPLHND